MYYSQYGQDKYLHHRYFSDNRAGVFVEIGANDGITLSNTYFFEKELGWKGVCIEPLPSAFQRLCENRSSLNLNWCITNQRRSSVDFLVVEGYAEMLSGIHANYASTHIQRIDGYLRKEGGSKYIRKMSSRTFMDIVQESGYRRIDYCSIDVEGAEIDILKGIDFNAVDVSVFSIENNYGSRKTARLMQKHGYSLVCRLGDDEIYEKTGTKSQKKALFEKIKSIFK